MAVAAGLQGEALPRRSSRACRLRGTFWVRRGPLTVGVGVCTSRGPPRCAFLTNPASPSLAPSAAPRCASSQELVDVCAGSTGTARVCACTSAVGFTVSDVLSGISTPGIGDTYFRSELLGCRGKVFLRMRVCFWAVLTSAPPSSVLQPSVRGLCRPRSGSTSTRVSLCHELARTGGEAAGITSAIVLNP